MVDLDQVEREYKNYAPGSRPWNMTVDMLHSGKASDGGQGSQGARNQLVGLLVNEGPLWELKPSSTVSGRIDITAGLVLIKDTVLDEYVVKAFAGGQAFPASAGDFVYLECAAGIVTMSTGSPSQTAVRLAVWQSGSAFVDVRKAGFILNTTGIVGIPDSVTICGPNDGQKLRVLKADGTEIFNINTITGIVSAIASEEHAINADKLGGIQDFPDESNPVTTPYIPVADPAKTLQPNLNADRLDGRDAGPLSGNVPISDTTLNADLNADMVDGRHATQTPTSDTIPVAETGQSKLDTAWLKTGHGNGLDADTVDGQHLDQDVRVAASPTFAGLDVGNKVSYLVFEGSCSHPGSGVGTPSNLDGNSRKIFKIIVRGIIHTTTDQKLYLRPNGLVTNQVSWRDWNGSASGGDFDGSNLVIANGLWSRETEFQVTIDFFAETGRWRGYTGLGWARTTDQTYFLAYRLAGVWHDTTNNLTSFTITASPATLTAKMKILGLN